MAQLQHPNYPLVARNEADAIALSFEGPDKAAVEYPFKFPQLQPNEIRIKELYLGICHSDSFIHLINILPKYVFTNKNGLTLPTLVFQATKS
jgi:hypothetical protein